MPTTWTDNPVVSGETRIRALHLNQVRTAVNSLRQVAGLHQVDWTDDPIVVGEVPFKAVHFNELAGAIQDLWLRRSLGRLPSWTVGSPPSTQRTIRASDMNDLRAWVNTYESSSTALDPQGIVSFSYDPNTPSAIITQAWVDDAIAIGDALPHQDTLLIRTNIRARQDTNAISQYYDEYADALSLWSSNGFDVAALFTNEFDVWDKIDFDNPFDYHPNHILDQNGGQANKYILHYASKAAAFASAMSGTGLKTFWLWNEPNRGPNIAPGVYQPSAAYISPQAFGALLYTTSAAIRSVVPDATIYAGSFELFHDQEHWQAKIQRVEEFLDIMYAYLRNSAIFPAPGVAGYGWDALSINIEGIFDYDYPQTVYNSMTEKQRLYEDRPSIVVGEWGTQNENFVAGDQDIEDMYLGIRFYFPTMYFFTHFWVPEDGTYGTMDLTNPSPPSNIDPVTHTYEVGAPKKWRNELRNNLYPIF